MPYSPSIIATSDYGDIRLSVGVASTDTTMLPDATIEGRPFLRHTEGRVKEDIPSYATILNTADVNYDAERADMLKNGVVLWTASRLAVLYFAARAGEEVQQETLGPGAVRYRDGPAWAEIARRLADDAADELYRVEMWGQSAQPIALFGRSGPTRKAADDEAVVSVRVWRERLQPPAVKRRDY